VLRVLADEHEMLDVQVVQELGGHREVEVALLVLAVADDEQVLSVHAVDVLEA
jgi:hypothetical protein